ncbi:hypothetical protein [Pimelobacter simplex]|uniref:hypothetical protein n=1 Tax=Nocardioides simplex TaxID=2045 RepID=UPI00214F7A4D|nr:hypothetical protein [Pimelobacter simplex]UUW88656.1 hypothetical protein M0M43_23370 [Pimelobacter simplex]UUW98161.1 hypothetical protein M0M48_12020 [Pimelobacter simplex]
MSNETPLRGTPTVRARVRRRLGGVICRRHGHRPILVESHYYVATGPVELVGEGRDLLSDLTFPVLGRRAEERQGREVICRRCLAPCGDTIPEVTR